LIDIEIPWLLILIDYDWLSWMIIAWLLIDLWMIMNDYEWFWMIMGDYEWLYEWFMNDYDGF